MSANADIIKMGFLRGSGGHSIICLSCSPYLCTCEIRKQSDNNFLVQIQDMKNIIFLYLGGPGGALRRTHGGGRRSPAVACWASDHWVASSNPLRGKFRH